MWNTTFKTAPSAGISMFGDNLSGVDRIGPVLSSVIHTLTANAASSLLSVYANDFTLINMFYAPNNISLGYIEVAPTIVDQDAGIAFTFALKPIKDKKKFKWPAVQDSRGRGLVIWGDSRTRYATVFVPKTELAKSQALMLLEPVLRTLYNVIGAATKNLMRNGRVSETECDPQYFHIYAKRGVVSSFEHMVDNVPISEWILCPRFWEAHSYMVWQKQLPALFPLYWCLYLDDEVYRLGMPDKPRALIESSCSAFIAPAFVMLQAAIATLTAPIKPAPELVALVARIRAHQGMPIDEARYAEAERYVTLYLVRVIAGCANTPSVREGLLSTMNSIRSSDAANCLVQGLVSTPSLKTVMQLLEAAFNASN